MCTLALYYRVFDDYPLIVAANRDEHYDRPAEAPTVLPSRPKIIAGKDLRAGGTWLGCNEHGLIVGILNRNSSSANAARKDVRSRGNLCMDLLTRSSASDADEFIRSHELHYNPFTVLVADPGAAYVAHNERLKIASQELEPGLHVFSSAADFSLHSSKSKRAESLFAGLASGEHFSGPELGRSVAALQTVLADHSLPQGTDNPGDAICVHREESGTVSSSILFFSKSCSRFKTFYCEGAPCRNFFGKAVELDLV